jgi:hypothetical protein
MYFALAFDFIVSLDEHVLEELSVLHNRYERRSNHMRGSDDGEDDGEDDGGDYARLTR